MRLASQFLSPLLACQTGSFHLFIPIFSYWSIYILHFFFSFIFLLSTDWIHFQDLIYQLGRNRRAAWKGCRSWTKEPGALLIIIFFFLSARPLVIKKRGKLLNIIGFPHSIRRCCLIFCQLTSLIIFSAKTYTSKTNSFTARATLQSAFYSLPYPIFLVRSNKKK